MSDYAFNKYQTVWFALHALLDEELSKEDQYTKDYVIDRLNDEFRFLYHEWPAVAEKRRSDGNLNAPVAAAPYLENT